MRRFTIYVDVDAAIDASNDGLAMEAAQRVATAVQEVIDAEGRPVYGQVTCHRGERNKRIFERDLHPPIDDRSE